MLVASAFGGLLASAIANMNGVGGYSNWRWIFILEGLATIIIGVVAFFTVSDFPDNSKWLTEDEKQFLIERNNKTSLAMAVDKVKLADVIRFFKDVRNILGGIIYFGMSSTEVKTMSHRADSLTLAMVVPIYGNFALCITLSLTYYNFQDLPILHRPSSKLLAIAPCRLNCTQFHLLLQHLDWPSF